MQKNRFGFLGVVAALALILGFHGQIWAGDLKVKDGWVRFSPPTAKVHAGYMLIENKSSKTRTLKAVESSAYGRGEIHKSFMSGGVMSMEKVDAVDIEPGKNVELKPGGMHIMLFEPKGKQVLGESTSVDLKFANGESVSVDMVISRSSPDGSASPKMDNHEGHEHH